MDKNPYALDVKDTNPYSLKNPIKDKNPYAIGQDKILSQSAPVTQAFGNMNPGTEVFSGGYNSGTDIGVQPGTQIATPPGQWQVIDSFDQAKNGYIGDNENQGYGNSIHLENMTTGERLRFSHLSQVGVKPGEQIPGGTVIGASGVTGNTSGPHVDIEYYDQNGQLGDVLQSPYGAYLQ